MKSDIGEFMKNCPNTPLQIEWTKLKIPVYEDFK